MTSIIFGPATYWIRSVRHWMDNRSELRTDMALRRGGLGDVAFHKLVAAVPRLDGGKILVT